MTSDKNRADFAPAHRSQARKRAPAPSRAAGRRFRNSLRPRWPVEPLLQFTRTVFERLGASGEDSKIAAEVLLEGELRGFDCHGLARLYPCYLRIRKGRIETKPQIRIRWRSAATGSCDGGNGIGMVVGRRAMEACIQRAEQFGAAFLSVRRSNHFGIAGYFSGMALEARMIGLAMCNASPRVVPTGGRAGVLGTNPISVAVPGGKGPPFLLDMATSAVSSGKIDVAVRSRAKIPEGWIYGSKTPFLDAEGVVPMTVLQLPLGGRSLTGGYKGYGLGLMVDLLSGVLSGANFGTKLAAAKSETTDADIGHFFGAFRIDGFRNPDDFFQDFTALVQDLKKADREPKVEEIFIPGEPEWNRRETHLRAGIPLDLAVVEKLREIALDLELDFPASLVDTG